MALAAAVVTRLQQAYMGAVKSARPWVLVSQSDLDAILVANDAGDTVAAAYSPSHTHGFPNPDASAS